jgi:hypothetical protein
VRCAILDRLLRVVELHEAELHAGGKGGRASRRRSGKAGSPPRTHRGPSPSPPASRRGASGQPRRNRARGSVPRAAVGPAAPAARSTGRTPSYG